MSGTSTLTVPVAGSSIAHGAESSRRERVIRLGYVSLLIVAACVPFVGVYPVFVMKLMCFALFASAFNLLLGFTGLLSFGHAAFFGFSAYTAGWLIKTQSLTPEVGILCGAASGAVLGWLVGLVAIRRQGIYFAMITLGLAQMVFFVCLQARFTGGEDGLQGIPRGRLLGVSPLESDTAMYYLVLVIFVGCMLAIKRIVTSPFGQVLKMIRENEPRAVSLGYQVDRFKLLAFVLSASLAGLAGAMKAVVMGFATLSDVHWSMSGEVILMSLLGGVGTFLGPILGAGIVVSMQTLLADKVGGWVTVIIGCVFVVCVLSFRKGIVGEFMAKLERKSH